MKLYDLVIIGGGISGMTSALAALKNGVKKILLLEREENLGGILNQCINNDFGKRYFGENVTGPEYIELIEREMKKYDVDIKINSEVLDISMDKVITYVNPEDGLVEVRSGAVMIATGCREKYTGNVAIPTNRFTGIYTIGNAHRIVNLEGFLPGKNPIVVANSKWALIVARRLIIEGAKIKGLLIEEGKEFIFGEDERAILEGFDVPIILDNKIIKVFGEERVQGVDISCKSSGEVKSMECDALILSVGYFPEVELARKLKIKLDEKTLGPSVNGYETSINGVFACGNLIYGVSSLSKNDVDGYEAGEKVATYIRSFIY